MARVRPILKDDTACHSMGEEKTKAEADKGDDSVLAASYSRRIVAQSSRCKSKALSAVFLSLRKNLASHSGVHVIL